MFLNIPKFLRTNFFTEHLRWLLLTNVTRNTYNEILNWGIELLRFTMKTPFISKKNVSLNYLEYDINLVLYSSDRKKLTNVIIWEMHGFPHKFSTVRENATKPMVWGKSGKLMLILFPKVWVRFFHPIPILWYTSSNEKCVGFPINFP